MPLVRSGQGHYFAAGREPGTVRHGGRDVRPTGAFFERPKAVVHQPVGRVGSSLSTTTPRDLPDGEYKLADGFKLNVLAGRAILTNGAARIDLTNVDFPANAPMGTTLGDGAAGALRWLLVRGDAGHVGGGRYDWVNPNIVMKYSSSSGQPQSTLTWNPTPA